MDALNRPFPGATPTRARAALRVLALAGTVLVATPVATAQDGGAPARKTVAASPAEPLQARHWYDGDRKRTVWLSPTHVVEFVGTGTGSDRLKSIDPDATVLRSAAGAARIWKVSPSRPDVAGRLKVEADGSRYSPLLLDARSDAAPRRALPGDVVVTFRPGWTDAQVRQWAASNGVELRRRLNLLGVVYVVASEPGLASLELANRIHESGQVENAAPNWWVEYR